MGHRKINQQSMDERLEKAYLHSNQGQTGDLGMNKWKFCSFWD